MKAKGETQYVGDIRFDGMLHGKVVWSSHPHAEIVSIDTGQADRMSGVKLVLTAKDIPGKNLYGVLVVDQPVLAENRVLYIGEPVAVVFAEDFATAEKGAQAVKVTYRELPGVFSMSDALAEGAPRLGANDNITKKVLLRRGDIDAAFNNADVIVEDYFSTSPIEHAYMETEAAIGVVEDDGKVAVYAANQSPFADRAQLARILGVGAEEVRVRHMPAGGAFGGKTELTVHAFVAIAALKTGRPARLALTRSESLRHHPKKHGYEMRYRIGARQDGELLGMDYEITSDSGAYTSWTTRVIEQSVAFGTGPYYIPALRGEGTGIFTNNLVMGAMRGFGANQVHFACESALDILARKLEMDPITLREKNALEFGSTMSTGQILREGVGFKKTLEAIRPLVESELLPLKQAEANVGIGIACGWRSVAGGLGPDEGAGAGLELEKDGKVLLKVACTEMGQGSLTALCQIVSDVMKIDVCSVRVLAGDTKLVPEGGGVMASRGVYLWGHAAAEASRKFRNLVLAKAATILERKEEEIDLIGDHIVEADGQKKLLSLLDLASRTGKPLSADVFYMLGKTFPMLEDANESLSIDPRFYKTHHTIAYNTTAVAVKVDRKEGGVKLLHAIVALDCGKILNPEAALTQVEAAVIMGMGYAVSEKFIIERGINKTNRLAKCGIPKITDTPGKITTVFVDNPDPTGPFESKGVAEMGILAITPAITNAIYDAVGIRVKSLPALDVLREAEKHSG